MNTNPALIIILCSTALWALVAFIFNNYFLTSDKIMSGVRGALKNSFKEKVGGEFSVKSLIEKNMHSSGAWDSLVQNIQEQVDYFLEVQLKEKIPVIFNLIGSDFLDQLKPLFKKTLEEKVPKIVNDFSNKLDMGIGQIGNQSGMVMDAIEKNLEPVLKKTLKTQHQRIYIFLIVAGAVVSSISILITHLVTG